MNKILNKALEQSSNISDEIPGILKEFKYEFGNS